MTAYTIFPLLLTYRLPILLDLNNISFALQLLSSHNRVPIIAQTGGCNYMCVVHTYLISKYTRVCKNMIKHGT